MCQCFKINERVLKVEILCFRHLSIIIVSTGWTMGWAVHAHVMGRIWAAGKVGERTKSKCVLYIQRMESFTLPKLWEKSGKSVNCVETVWGIKRECRGKSRKEERKYDYRHCNKTLFSLKVKAIERDREENLIKALSK